MINTILVGLGGGLGALARYTSGAYIEKKTKSKIPLGTLFVNVLGSFSLGYLSVHLHNRGLLLFLGTGFLGGFTTFSTFMLENLNLVLDGNKSISYIYVGLSLVLSICACFVGVLV
nr:CrcB family protein [uncultured Peptostreptococcus sp.]